MKTDLTQIAAQLDPEFGFRGAASIAAVGGADRDAALSMLGMKNYAMGAAKAGAIALGAGVIAAHGGEFSPEIISGIGAAAMAGVTATGLGGGSKGRG